MWSDKQIESAIGAAAKDLGYSQLTEHQSLVLRVSFWLARTLSSAFLPVAASRSATGCYLELSMLF